MKSAGFDYAAPPDVAAALSLMAGAAGEARYLAGSQSLGPMLNLRLVQPDLLIDLRRIDELSEVSETADAVRLGARITHATIEDGRVPDPARGLLRHVARGIAYRPVRNRGTLGGSLAHADPAADWVSTMALLDAAAVIRGAGGERRVPVDGFVLGPYTTVLGEDELLTAVELPKLSGAARWGHYKFCRKTGDFAHAIAGVLVDPERGVERAVLGATDGAPVVITGPMSPDRAAEALDTAGITDAVKRQLLLAALHRALLAAGERSVH